MILKDYSDPCVEVVWSRKGHKVQYSSVPYGDLMLLTDWPVWFFVSWSFCFKLQNLERPIHRPDFSCSQCLVAFAACWLDTIITINNLNWVLTMVPDTVPKTPLILTLSQWERCLYPWFFFFFFYRLSDETVPQRELDWSGLKSRCLWLHVLAALFGFLVPLQYIMEKKRFL